VSLLSVRTGSDRFFFETLFLTLRECVSQWWFAAIYLSFSIDGSSSGRNLLSVSPSHFFFLRRLRFRPTSPITSLDTIFFFYWPVSAPEIFYASHNQTFTLPLVLLFFFFGWTLPVQRGMCALYAKSAQSPSLAAWGSQSRELPLPTSRPFSFVCRCPFLGLEYSGVDSRAMPPLRSKTNPRP